MSSSNSESTPVHLTRGELRDLLAGLNVLRCAFREFNSGKRDAAEDPTYEGIVDLQCKLLVAFDKVKATT